MFLCTLQGLTLAKSRTITYAAQKFPDYVTSCDYDINNNVYINNNVNSNNSSKSLSASSNSLIHTITYITIKLLSIY